MSTSTATSVWAYACNWFAAVWSWVVTNNPVIVITVMTVGVVLPVFYVAITATVDAFSQDGGAPPPPSSAIAARRNEVELMEEVSEISKNMCSCVMMPDYCYMFSRSNSVMGDKWRASSGGGRLDGLFVLRVRGLPSRSTNIPSSKEERVYRSDVDRWPWSATTAVINVTPFIRD